VPGGSVDGRLLAVDDTGLERLDHYEGVEAELYVRVAVPVTGAAGTASERRCWVYVGDPDQLGVDATWPGRGRSATAFERTFHGAMLWYAITNDARLSSV